MAQRTLTVRLIGDDRSLRAATTRSQGAMSKFAGFAKKAAKIGAAGVVVGTVASVKAFADFDKAMTESLAIMGDVSKKQRGEMVDAAREVGRTTRFSAREAGEAYFFLASAGLDAQQALKAMPQVASFAQAGNFDLATATDLVTDAQSALGLSTKKAGQNLQNMARTSDVLVKANTLANASVEQFSQSITNKAGAAAKVLGKDVEETTAILAAFADQGVKGELAGNALNIVWRDLQTAALKNKGVFKEHNVEVYNSQGEFRNTAAVVGDLEKALSGMSDEEKKATLTKLGFQDRSQAFILTLLGTSKKIREYESELRKAGGTTKTVADKQLEGLTGSFTLLKGEIQDGALALGGALAPTLQKTAEWMRGFVAEIRTGTGAGGDFRSVVEGIADVLIPVGGALGGLSVDLLGFVGDIATTKVGMIALSAAAGGLAGRMIGLAAVWSITKISAFSSAIAGAITMVRTAIQITTSYRAALGLLSASMVASRAAMLSTGIGAIAVLAGTAIGALMGMSSASDHNRISAEQLTEALRTQRNIMREVQDTDLDLAQRKTNLAAANQAVSRAQQRVNQLERSGQKGTLSYREAVNRLNQSRIEQKRASRQVARGESDAADKQRNLREETRKTTRTAHDRIGTLKEEISGASELNNRFDGLATKTGIMARLMINLARENKRVADSQRQLKEQQLKVAEASGQSQGKISKLKDEIEKLRSRSSKSKDKVGELRKEIQNLPLKKKTQVEVWIDFGFAGGGLLKNSTGSGWSLSEHIDSGVEKKVQGAAKADPFGFLGATMGVGGGGGGAGSVDAFTPYAANFGLGMTSGFRPGDDGYHGINRARDYSNSTGPTSQMLAFAQFMATAFGPILRELIYTPLGFCVPLDTQVLTRRGWLHHDEVRVGDETIGYNQESGRSEWTTIRDVHHFDEPHELTEIRSKAYKFRATPNHRWLTERRTKTKDGRQHVEEFVETRELTSEHRIVAAAPVEEDRETLGELDRAGDDLEALVLRLSTVERRAMFEAMMEAEGSVTKTGQRTFSQNEGAVLEAFVLLAYLLGERPSRYRAKPDNSLGSRPHQIITLAKPRVGGVGTGLHQRPAGAEPVWCVTTDLGTWTAQQNGVVTLTGNSIKDGAKVPPYAAAEHFNHVHVALQQGGFVPGTGSGDKVPRMVPDGTFVMNRVASSIAGLQRGGMVRVMLEPGERVFYPGEVAKVGLGNLMAINDGFPRHMQRGGHAAQREGPKWEPAFKQRMSRLWQRAAPLYGKAGTEPPPVWFPQGLTRSHGHVAQVTKASGKPIIGFDQGWARQFLRGGQYPQQVLLHEWAHAFQGSGLARWEREGGATMFERYASQKLFGKSRDKRWPAGYRKFAEAVEARHGWPWIKHTQFLKGGGVAGWMHGSGSLNADQLATLAHYVGMPNPGLMSQIAQAESSGNPGVTNSIGARGLWQIIPSTAAAFGLSYGSLTDPLANARGARKILAEQGLGAWEAFTTGAYSRFPKGNVLSTKSAPKRHRPPPGSVGRGGGTQGPAGKKRKGEKKPSAPGRTSLPGLGAGSVPKALQGLSPGITSLFKGPGMSRAERFEASDTALQLSEATGTTDDDRAVLQYQRGAAQRRKKAIQKEIARINARLKGRLTKSQRKSLIGKRNRLGQELGEAQGRIVSAREGLANLNEGGEEEGEDPAAVAAREAAEAAQKAAEEAKQSQEELKAAIDALNEEMAQTRRIAETEQAVGLREARRALADLISGELGPKIDHRSRGAGDGTVGSVRRF